MSNLSKKPRLYLRDVFTTAVDMQWRWTLLLFAAAFFLSWLAFGGVYYGICWCHGDFDVDNLPGGVNQGAGNFTPCVWAIHNFASCFLFSVETQHTIG